MTKIFSLFLVVIFLLLGCTSPVKDDLTNYINVELTNISEFENDALKTYEDFISKENYTSEELYTLLKEHTIPTYTNFVQHLKTIDPTTKEVKEVHNFYIQGAEKQLEAFKILIEGIEEKDNEKVGMVNKMLNQSKEYIDLFKSKIELLANEYGLKYTLE